MNKISWNSHKQGQAKVIIAAWNHQQFMVEKRFQKKYDLLCLISWKPSSEAHQDKMIEQNP